MSLRDIRAGLKRTLEAATGVGPVLAYPPKAIPANYTVYFARAGFEPVRVGQVRGVRWEFTARLVIFWQDPEQAEADLDRLTEAILDAVDASPRLDGALSNGLAEITAGEDGWFQLEGAQVWYRFCDFEISVLEKG